MDVHAMRHTFGTHLSKGGVSLRTAQAAMRHSDPKLTANVYTDPKLLDVAGSLDALPLLPLDDSPRRERAKATGTDSFSLVPNLVTKADFQRTQGTNAGKASANGSSRLSSVTPAFVALTQAMSFTDEYTRRGSNPQPADPKSAALSN